MTLKASFLSTLIILFMGTAMAQDYPEPPSPVAEGPVLREKAGYGSTVSYAEAGVLELGGSISFVTANEFNQVSLSPTVGWFFTNNFQISGILALHRVSQGANDTLYWTLLAEPSYHYPFTKTVFGFVGLGLGIAHSDAAGDGAAIQPRLGANFLVGRSGILTPSIFVAYNAIEAQAVGGGVDLLSVDQLAGLNISYTVIW